MKRESVEIPHALEIPSGPNDTSPVLPKSYNVATSPFVENMKYRKLSNQQAANYNQPNNMEQDYPPLSSNQSACDRTDL